MERVRYSVTKGVHRRRPNTKVNNTASPFYIQCIVSLLLIVVGFLINYSKAPALETVKDAFNRSITVDGGLEKISQTLNTLIVKEKTKSPSDNPENKEQDVDDTSQDTTTDDTSANEVPEMADVHPYIANDAIKSDETEETMQIKDVITQVSEVKDSDNTADKYPDNAIDENMNLPVVLLMPISGKITSDFGFRVHPTLERELFHYGVDIAAPEGTNIKASAGGEVYLVGKSTFYGNYVILQHDDLTYTFYGHCKEIKVSTGQKVGIKDTIATVGTTGVSTGNHLHFEVRYNNNYLNPLKNIIR